MRKRICPGCGNHMAEVLVVTAHDKPCLDVCTLCQFVWFDYGEYETLPTLPKNRKAEDELPQAAREKLALLQLQADREEARKNVFGEYTPDSWLEWVVGFLGMPIEQDAPPVYSVPWVTWGVTTLITIISLVAFLDLPAAINGLGLIPAQFTRHGGLTFLTSFFIHGSVLHLLGNIYFLLIFGDNVEEHLGKKRFLLLIAYATAGGAIAHILGDATSEIPCIGASGGISGILAFYALKFPEVRIGFLLRFFWWFSLPASLMFLIWIALQFFGVWTQQAGFSHVAALAHLGGAGVGLIFWLATRKN